jgi:hypothetical protein
VSAMSAQMCLNCGERPAVTKTGKTVPLCEECASKAGGSRGVKMAPKDKKLKLKAIDGGRA